MPGEDPLGVWFSNALGSALENAALLVRPLGNEIETVLDRGDWNRGREPAHFIKRQNRHRGFCQSVWAICFVAGPRWCVDPCDGRGGDEMLCLLFRSCQINKNAIIGLHFALMRYIGIKTHFLHQGVGAPLWLRN